MTTQTERGQVTLIIDNISHIWEHEVTSVDDWRETPFGLVNFGYVIWGPWRVVKEKVQ